MHEMKFFNGIFETPDEAVERIDDIGGPHSHTNYPWGWAQCGNTPFKWYKQNTHEGGVHVPMVVHWPERIGADAARHQARPVRRSSPTSLPTIYELVGVTPPEVYRGVEQLPVTGHSFAAALADAGGAGDEHSCSTSRRAAAGRSWRGSGRRSASTPPGADYDTRTVGAVPPADRPSRSADDLAAEQPERLAELQDLWWQEAERHGVLPLDDRMFELFGARFRDHSPHPANRRYVYRPPMSPMPGQAVGGDRWAQLRPHRPRHAGTGRRRRAVRDRHARTRGRGVRAGRPARGRLQRIRRPHHRRVGCRIAGRRRDG